MKKTRLIGDIHGKWYEYQLITQPINHNSIQVGDFGIGFGQGDYWHDKVNDFHASKQHRFIRGNHDNPSICKNDMVGYIQDGLIENNIMFVGGAWSIDKDYRTPGVSWWQDEELSIPQFNAIIDTYSVVKPDIMITHDCPSLAAYHMFVRSGKNLGPKALYLSRTGEALQAMFEIHQPKHWFFGHWHHTINMTIDGTMFQCIGELDFIDFDLENMEKL